MPLKRKEKMKRRQRAGIYRSSKSGASNKSYDSGERTCSASRAEGLPPNENLKKHPDEVYGDTDIPRRGKLLTALKR